MERWWRSLVCLMVSEAMLVGLVPMEAQGTSHEPSGQDGQVLVRLQGLLEEALANNPELLSARKRWEATQQKVIQAKALPAPRVGIEFEEIPRGTVKVNQATLMYQLIQSLPFPGKLSGRKRVAVKEAQVAAMAFKQAEWETISQVKTVYYELWLNDREQELWREQLIWLTPAAGVAQARYATGGASQLDVLQAQQEALSAANTLAVLEERRLAMAAHLNHLLNRPSHIPVGKPGPLALHELTLSPEELLLMAQERQPELLAFKYSAERADAALSLAKRELLPDLETMVELRDPAIGPFGPWDLTLALVIPFWFWTKWKYGIKAAIYDQASAHAAYQAMQNMIARRVHEHWHEARASYRTAKLCEDRLIDLARQAVGSALSAYQGGRGPFLELLGDLRRLAEQRRTYNEHLVAFEQHVVMLEQAAGVPLRSGSALADAGAHR